MDLISLHSMFTAVVLFVPVAMYKMAWKVFCWFQNVMLWGKPAPANSVAKVNYWGFMWDDLVDGVIIGHCVSVFRAFNQRSMERFSSTGRRWEDLICASLPGANIAQPIDTVLLMPYSPSICVFAWSRTMTNGPTTTGDDLLKWVVVSLWALQTKNTLADICPYRPFGQV